MALTLAAVAGFECWRGLELQEQLRERREKLAAAEVDLARALQRERDEATARIKPPDYATDAAAVARLARFPVPEVLRSLESTLMPGIKVLSLDLSANEWTARAEVEFTDHETLLQFVKQFNEGEPVPRWRLLQAHAAASSGVGRASLISSWHSME